MFKLIDRQGTNAKADRVYKDRAEVLEDLKSHHSGDIENINRLTLPDLLDLGEWELVEFKEEPTQKAYPEDIAIKVWYSHDNGGYMYSLIDDNGDEDTDELDGGCCTGTLTDAIEMASDEAQKYFKREEYSTARDIDITESIERAKAEENN